MGRALALNDLGHVSLARHKAQAKGVARDAVALFKNSPDIRVGGCGWVWLGGRGWL